MAVSFSISEIRAIANALSEKLNMPFNQMTHSFLKRRLNEVFEINGFRKLDNLNAEIEDEIFADEFKHQFSVKTTELFRDPSFWRTLRKTLLSDYLDKKINIYMPDLSSGEELYSLIILLKEIDVLDKVSISVVYQSDKCADFVKNGKLFIRKMDINTYNYKRFEGISSLDCYFNEKDDGYYFNTAFLENINFQKSKLSIEDSSRFDLILYRNSMLYFSKDYHEVLKNSFDAILKPGGFLCIGVKEELIAPYNERFECVDSKEKIYRKFSFLKN